MFPSEYEALTTPAFRSRHGSSYSLCIGGCILGLWEKLTQTGSRSATVSIFIESGHNNSVEGLETIANFKKATDSVDIDDDVVLIGSESSLPATEIGLKISAYGEASKRDTSPLWAADLLSYCIHGQIKNPNDEFCANVMNAIEEKVECPGVPWDTERIQEFISTASTVREERRKWDSDRHAISRYLGRYGIKVRRHELGAIVDTSEASEDQMKNFLRDRCEGKE